MKTLKIFSASAGLLILTACSSVSVSRNGIIVDFPNTGNYEKNSSSAFISEERLEGAGDKGILVYHGVSKLPRPVSKELFDKIKSGMTVRELTDLLGPGYQKSFSGGREIYWNSEDGRILAVTPGYFRLERKAEYRIEEHTVNKKHDAVKKIVTELIAGIAVNNGKAYIVFAKNISGAKAGEMKSYLQGWTIQYSDEELRIDFTIMKIFQDGVVCRYFYQTDDGITRFSESGTIVIKPGI